jgi:hypothetical protein
MKIKIFCHCSLFPSWSGYGLNRTLVYWVIPENTILVAMYQVRIPLFRDTTQRSLVLVNKVSGQPAGPIFRGQAVPDWDRRVFQLRSPTTNPRSITFQKGEDLVYKAPEVWNHTVPVICCVIFPDDIHPPNSKPKHRHETVSTAVHITFHRNSRSLCTSGGSTGQAFHGDRPYCHIQNSYSACFKHSVKHALWAPRPSVLP